MALEAAVKFLDRLEREETLRQQLYISSVRDIDKLLQFAHGKGFVVKKEELETAIRQYKPKLPTANLAQLKELVAKN